MLIQVHGYNIHTVERLVARQTPSMQRKRRPTSACSYNNSFIVVGITLVVCLNLLYIASLIEDSSNLPKLQAVTVETLDTANNTSTTSSIALDLISHCSKQPANFFPTQHYHIAFKCQKAFLVITYIIQQTNKSLIILKV